MAKTLMLEVGQLRGTNVGKGKISLKCSRVKTTHMEQFL